MLFTKYAVCDSRKLRFVKVEEASKFKETYR